MTDYKSLNLGDSITIESEGVALAIARWGVRVGRKFARRKVNDGRYVVERVQ